MNDTLYDKYNKKRCLISNYAAKNCRVDIAEDLISESEKYI